MIPFTADPDDAFAAARVPHIQMVQGWLPEAERRVEGP